MANVDITVFFSLVRFHVAAPKRQKNSERGHQRATTYLITLSLSLSRFAFLSTQVDIISIAGKIKKNIHVK